MKSILARFLSVPLVLFSQITFAQEVKDSSSYQMDSITCQMLCDSIPVIVYTSFSVSVAGKMDKIRIDSVNCFDCSETKINHFKNEAFKFLATIPPWEPVKKRKKRNTLTRYIQPIRFDLN